MYRLYLFDTVWCRMRFHRFDFTISGVFDARSRPEFNALPLDADRFCFFDTSNLARNSQRFLVGHDMNFPTESRNLTHFRPIAVGALLTTVAACILIIIQALIDHEEVYEGEVARSDPTIEGSIKAFASIMFAFAGASTFPTIQADMKHKDQFKFSAIIACTSKLLSNSLMRPF